MPSGVAFFSALIFVGGIAVLVLLTEPPGVVVAIITVVVVGVLSKRSYLPRSGIVPRLRRIKNRAVAHRPHATTDPIADQDS